MTAPDDDVPRLPRGRGFKLDAAMMVRIALTLGLLVILIIGARPCATATSKFVMGFGEEGSASKTMPKPGNVDVPAPEAGSAGAYERLGPDMSEAEIKAAIERAKQRAAAQGSGAASGSAATDSAGSGSAATGSAATGSAATGSAGTGSATSGR